MRSTFHLLETAKRSLFTQQAALSTTGHNIANANTPGFSRQVTNMTESIPIEAFGINRSNAPGQLGTGVEVTSITRIREKFLDDQYRNENKAAGSWNIQSDTLEKLEKIMNEPTDSGLRTVLDNFWKAWSDLSKDPESVSGRKVVKETAVALADTFNFTSSKLKDLQGDLTNNINLKSNEINSLSSSIANLNLEIKKIESLGDDANDLRDQRDLITDNLSKIVNVQVVETPDGYTVNMGSTNLVTGDVTVPTTSASLMSAYSSGDLNSGEVHGMIVSRDKFVTDYQNQLDTLADTIANGDITVTIPKGTVLPDNTIFNGITYTGASRTLASDITVTIKGLNGLHHLGYTLENPAKTGLDFFTAKAGSTQITADSIQFNPIIDGDTSKIASSMRTSGAGATEAVVKGNNTMALLMGQLKDTNFDFNSANAGAILGSGTLDDFFRSIVSQLGVQAQEASRQQSNQKTLVDQVESRRQSVSGVSLDEEMSDMIKFQHAYSAAARVMTTFDEMLDKVINGMGVVGR
ncbi:flagellar hook-associated protein 1 FlgK [Paenibacillus sp. V4I3]|uniref:flagellar hook-associated protein FlgK n=1 Tax=Paenibacillus sp. V4I3 TaxID=3042305 RepID=UPI00277E6F15|nr:flagellar hook-associated protein FlgK [Paenibacillus sp. V4I3]MDQ0872151.1 flagellar hook-associated protein 1 FlgK [Paenibacillus sp. V4I3]